MPDERWEFLGWMDDQQCDSVWRHPDGRVLELTPVGITARGLNDHMRSVLIAQDEPVIYEPQRDQEAQLGVVTLKDEKGARQYAPDGLVSQPGDSAALSLIGGWTEGWRWQFVEDDGSVLVCLDNKPAIDAATAAGERVPKLYQCVVPIDVLRQVVPR